VFDPWGSQYFLETIWIFNNDFRGREHEAERADTLVCGDIEGQVPWIMTNEGND
jgi:hypothetical protein